MVYRCTWFQAVSGALLLQQAAVKLNHQKETVPLLMAVCFDAPEEEVYRADALKLSLGAWFQKEFTDRIRRCRSEAETESRIDEASGDLCGKIEKAAGSGSGVSCAGLLCAGRSVYAWEMGDSQLRIRRFVTAFGRRKLLPLFGTEAEGIFTLSSGEETRILVCPDSWITAHGEESLLSCLTDDVFSREDRMDRRLREIGDGRSGAAVLFCIAEEGGESGG